MAGGVGTPVTPSVANQIAARQRVIGKKVGRTNEDLLYMNSKAGWIKLSSAVNTLSPGQQAQLRGGMDPNKILGNNARAKSNILLGGLLSPNGGLRQGIDVDGGYNQNAAYNNRADNTGIRPMPGITSMNVKSKNTYGTLREAEVKFMCWTLQDFEAMEELYLRPGYTILLEWGHSMYIDNSGNLQKDVQTVGDMFFLDGTTMCQLTQRIGEIRKSADNNYEAMIGYVKNFSWNYTPDGGYNCSVSIISTGEILESIQIRFDPAQRGAVLEDPTTDAGKEQAKSIYHFFISKMANITDRSSINIPTIQEQLGPIGDKLLIDNLVYFQKVTFDETSYWYDKAAEMHWISLRLFFDIFNTQISPVDTSKAQGTCSRTLTRFNTDFAKSSKFLTSPEHFSIDPSTCVLAKPGNLTTEDVIEIKAVHTGFPPVGDLDDVLNIYISLPYLKTVLDGALDESGKLNKSMHDITETILEGVNTCLGGINDLGLAYDDEDEGGTWYVVDRNNTPEDSSNLPIFTLAGIDSVFTDVGISSKISNEIGAQISIAAQGSTSGTTEYVENILKWNAGTVDRIKVVKTTIDTPDANAIKNAAAVKKEQEERAVTWLEDVKTFFNNFNSYQGYEKEEMEAAKTMHAEWTVANVVTKYRTQTNSSLPGIVPVELSFKLDGIGGFIIGQAFKVGAGILPSKYQDRFGYIVTGIEHGIDSKNRWETSIGTQFYPIDKPSAEEVQAAGKPGVTAREAANREANVERRLRTANPTKVPPKELIEAMRRYGINSPLERAHFLAQCAHESGGFAFKKEFASGTAYEGRKALGNTQPGDGVKFKGRGYIQITGRANYQKYQDYLKSIGSKTNIITNPELLESNYFAADSACYWWKYLSYGISGLANAGTSTANVSKVSTRVNGQSPANGLSDRQSKFDGYWSKIEKDNTLYA
jgi:putative chitinase